RRRRQPSRCERRAEQLQTPGGRRVEAGELDDATQPVVQGVGMDVQGRRGLATVEIVAEVDLEGERQIGIAVERVEQLCQVDLRVARPGELVLEQHVAQQVTARWTLERASQP